MRYVYTEIPPLIIHILIRLYGALSFLLDTFNLILSPIKKIKFKIHCLCALLLAAGTEVYHYYAQNGFDLPRAAKVFGIYIASVLAIKILFRPFDNLCYRIRMDYRSYFVRPGVPRYVVSSRKEYYKEMPKKMTYKVQMDFDEPVQYFTDLNLLVAELKRAGHVFVYSTADGKYKEMAEECCVDPTKTPLYVETSVSTEGTFVESEAFWVENYLTGEFYSPEKRPHIEKYLQ